MRKVTVELKLKATVSVDEGVEISHVIDELYDQVRDTTTSANILDTEIIDYEVIDSK